MSSAFALALAAASGFTPAQAERIDCVAVLAIVAAQQQQGEAGDVAPVGARGARFAQVTGERLMAERGIAKEAVRDAIVAAVARRQQAATEGGRRDPLPRTDIDRCVAMMDEDAPPPPPPGLPQCAAMLALASEAAGGGDRDLRTIASVLDHRAREQLRAEGRSGPEIDREMTLTREATAAEARRREEDGVSAGLDYAPCLEMARP